MFYAKKYWAGGGVVYNFVPFVAPESFNDPRKYADFGLTVNLYEKFKIYKMTYPGADVAVEFSDEIESVVVTLPYGVTIEIFETVAGVETSVLITSSGTHTFTSGSTKRYMIRRVSGNTLFTLPIGSVWAYCYGITNLAGSSAVGSNSSLNYVFFYENTLTALGWFIRTAITGTLVINGGVTTIAANQFAYCTNLTKVIIGNQLTTIIGNSVSGAFMQCTGLLEADLGEGITSIGSDTFMDCTSLQVIYLRSHIPPTITTITFRNVPSTTIWKVPAEDLDTYKGWTNYTTFADRIFAI